MKYKKIINPILFFTIIILGTVVKSYSQNNAAAFAAADSSRFSINNNGGWQLYNSYLNKYKPDSVQVEIIIQHNNNINWQQEQYIGKIKFADLKPTLTQKLPFSLLDDNYILSIDNNGKCYLKWVSGNLPAASPVVVPIKAYYKL